MLSAYVEVLLCVIELQAFVAFKNTTDMFTLGVCAPAQTGAVLLGIQKYVILCTHFENGALFCSIRGNLKM